VKIHVGSKNLVADVAIALDVAGREHLVIIAKSTWCIPAPGQRPRPLPPEAIEQNDVYYGAPGESALRYGADTARFKPRCDIVFDAVAHSPTGKPVTELLAQIEVGTMKKQIRVLGNRRWTRLLGINKLTDPQPFTEMPLHYGLAFGGTRWYEKGSGTQHGRLCEAHLANPAGLGFAGKQTMEQMHNEAAPNLEDAASAIRNPDSKSAPAALSAIGRHWLPRRDFAGTYDEVWQRDVFPLLPADFDERFHQSAPSDQQIGFPSGGEAVCLKHIVKGRPEIKFNLPRLSLQVHVLRTDYSSATPPAVVDTLFFETEAQRFSAVWRASVPLLRRLKEIDSVAVGPVDPVWWQGKISGREGGGCIGCADPAAQASPAIA
jgi:hypothetical protein